MPGFSFKMHQIQFRLGFGGNLGNGREKREEGIRGRNEEGRGEGERE